MRSNQHYQPDSYPFLGVVLESNNNEAYFYCTKEIEAIIDKSGSVVSAEIQGYIDCGIKLSGYFSLSLSFVNPNSLFS
uniref:MHD domain-containing protein n=1 Tax=Tetranychus urticae TaxID=32264 RepID=T1L4X8_TETUR